MGSRSAGMVLGEDSALQRMRESAQRDRDEDLADISRMRDVNFVDSPAKKMRMERVLRDFDARCADLRAQRDAPDLAHLAPSVVSPTHDTSSVFVFPRVKVGAKELVSHCGIRAEPTMTYLALVEETVRRHSPSDWDRLQLFPVIVDTSA